MRLRTKSLYNFLITVDGRCQRIFGRPRGPVRSTHLPLPPRPNRLAYRSAVALIPPSPLINDLSILGGRSRYAAYRNARDNLLTDFGSSLPSHVPRIAVENNSGFSLSARSAAFIAVCNNSVALPSRWQPVTSE